MIIRNRLIASLKQVIKLNDKEAIYSALQALIAWHNNNKAE